MKTFAEAVAATMLRKKLGNTPGTEAEAKAVFDELAEIGESYASLHEEIQLSDEAEAFAQGLIRSMPPEFHLEDFIIIAFAHGVMVGIEMEKSGNPT